MDSNQLWTLTDGRAGNLRQATALAQALGLPWQDWPLQSRAPWRWAAPRRLPGARAAFGDGFAEAMLAPPALAIGCGRQAALATRLLQQAGGRVVQILDPRIDTRHWDLVVAPQHDGLSGANVIPLLGSLNPVDDAWLERARNRDPATGQLPGPRTLVLLGGSSPHYDFDLAAWKRLEAALDAQLAGQGSVLASTSRRTGEGVAFAVRQRYARAPHQAWCGPQDGPNPYAGWLAWADRVVVTPDSVNMLSEACATHAQVFVFEPDSAQGRPRQYVDALLQRGRVRPLAGTLDAYPCVPLRETARVAAEVRARLGLPAGTASVPSQA